MRIDGDGFYIETKDYKTKEELEAALRRFYEKTENRKDEEKMTEFTVCESLEQFLLVSWMIAQGIDPQLIRLTDHTTAEAVHEGGFCLRCRWMGDHAEIWPDDDDIAF